MMNAFTTKHTGIARVLINEVGLSSAYDMSGGIQAPMANIKAIWDTGASMSTITKKLVARLNLQPSGKIRVRNTTVETERDTYFIHLYLPNKVVIENVKVVDCEDLLGNADMLIGMDIMVLGDLAITNLNGITVFSFVTPSNRTIDYVEEANRLNQRPPVIARMEEERKRRLLNASRSHKKKKKRK